MDIIIFIDYIGFYGPIITFITTFYYLLNQQSFIYTPFLTTIFKNINQNIYLLLFILGSITNISINEILKNTIQEPRPIGQKYFIDSNELTGPHLYGMPSAHTQSCFFALTYIYLLRGPTYSILFMLFISLLTFYQRWKYNRHTILQLLIGSIIGSLYAWCIITITQYYLYR